MFFYYNFNLEEAVFEPGAASWKSSTLPSELSNCINIQQFIYIVLHQKLTNFKKNILLYDVIDAWKLGENETKLDE